MQRLCRSLGALSVAFVACFAGSASGAIEVVNTQTVAGRLLTSGNLTLSWDWSWEWVPADATTATVAVRSWRKGVLKSASFSRGQATSVAWENLVAGDEDDRLELTLAFTGSSALGAVAMTNVLYALKGGFGAAQVRSVAADSPQWKSYRYPLVFPYDAAWSGAAGEASLSLKDRATDEPAVQLALEGSSGVAFLGVARGDLPRSNWLAGLWFGDEQAASALLDFMEKGMFVIFQ